MHTTLPKAPGPFFVLPTTSGTSCYRLRSEWQLGAVALEEADHVTVLVQDGDIVVSVAGFYAVYFKPQKISLN